MHTHCENGKFKTIKRPESNTGKDESKIVQNEMGFGVRQWTIFTNKGSVLPPVDAFLWRNVQNTSFMNKALSYMYISSLSGCF